MHFKVLLQYGLILMTALIKLQTLIEKVFKTVSQYGLVLMTAINKI